MSSESFPTAQGARIWLPDSSEREDAFGALIGQSDVMQDLYELLRAIGPSGASVLIVGESGTGKELVARTLHALSPRHGQRFVALNCAAIPETLLESELLGHEKGAFTGADTQRPGCFELADRGTLFLDELAAIPNPLQAKLLRVLEERTFRRLRGTREITVDVRVLSAMNQDPEEAVEEGKLREDLLFRLNVFTLRIPPLRERASDIPLLAEVFVEELSRRNRKRIEGLEPDAVSALLSHPWPGNVRELRNVIERAVILEESPRIRKESLPELGEVAPEDVGARDGSSEATEPIARVGMTVDDVTRRLILRTLEATNFNRTRAAELLGISSKTVYNKLKQWNIQRPPANPQNR